MEDVVRKSICAAKEICKEVDEAALENAAKLLYDTCNKPGFIVDFDVVWKLVGYSTKWSAKRKLLQDFTEGIDYETRFIKNTGDRNKGHTGGNPEEKFLLTSTAMKKFCVRSPKAPASLVKFISEVWKEADKFSLLSCDAFKRRKQINKTFFVERKKELELTKVSEHSKVQHELLKLEGGVVESPNRNGVSDIETNSEVIEIKPVGSWMHGLGQALGYSAATGKRPRLHLYGGKLYPDQEEVLRKLKVRLTYHRHD